MSDFAMWRRLDTPGHDGAVLTRTDAGWALRGMAVFRHPLGPACIRYGLDLDRSWTARRGTVEGFLAGTAFRHVIVRGAGGWSLDDTPVPGLAHLADLDYGFTPATNLPQLRRLTLRQGQSADLPVAWFDIDRTTLVALPQRYERHGNAAYWYTAPTVPYEALLELSENGFVRRYPRLWEMES